MEWGLLAGLDAPLRRQVLGATVRRSVRKGDAVFREGDPGDALHLLESGRVAVRISTPAGEEATLVVLGPGASFGELALRSPHQRRSASVIALSPVVTLALHQRDFEALCAAAPGVERFLVELLAQQVQRLSGQVLQALYVPADQRVVMRLRDVMAVFDERGRRPIQVELTQEDLATMAGTTRPTANRALQGLVREGAIELHRGRIVVLDPDAVVRRAAGDRPG